MGWGTPFFGFLEVHKSRRMRILSNKPLFSDLINGEVVVGFGDNFGDVGDQVTSTFSIFIGQREVFQFGFVVIGVHDDHGIAFVDF